MKKHFVDTSGDTDFVLKKYLLQQSLIEEFQLNDEVLEVILGNFDEFYAMVRQGVSIDDAIKFFTLLIRQW